MAGIEFITAEVCPFAERTRLLLKEKGIQFTHTEVDREAKPDWFEVVSPYSKVPVLRSGEDLVWESAVINEYIEETHPEPPMLPKAPGRRALARFWIDFCNVKFVVTWYKALLAQEAVEQEALLDQLGEHMLFMERDGIAKSGDGSLDGRGRWPGGLHLLPVVPPFAGDGPLSGIHPAPGVRAAWCVGRGNGPAAICQRRRPSTRALYRKRRQGRFRYRVGDHGSRHARRVSPARPI